jgi:chromosome segregation ATPase
MNSKARPISGRYYHSKKHKFQTPRHINTMQPTKRRSGLVFRDIKDEVAEKRRLFSTVGSCSESSSDEDTPITSLQYEYMEEHYTNKIRELERKYSGELKKLRNENAQLKKQIEILEDGFEEAQDTISNGERALDGLEDQLSEAFCEMRKLKKQLASQEMKNEQLLEDLRMNKDF